MNSLKVSSGKEASSFWYAVMQTNWTTPKSWQMTLSQSQIFLLQELMAEGQRLTGERENENVKKWKEGLQKKANMMKTLHVKSSRIREPNNNNIIHNDFNPAIDLQKPFPSGCDRIHLKLTSVQLNNVKKIFGVTTWCYNKAVEMIFRTKKLILPRKMSGHILLTPLLKLLKINRIYSM